MKPHPPIIVAAGIRFELYYALYRSFEAAPPDWLPAPSMRVADRFAELGGWPFAWIGIADTVAGAEAEAGFTELDCRLSAQPPGMFATRWLTSHLHDPATAAALVDRRCTLAEAINALPARKREWLAHVGLYPVRAAAPGPALLQRLLDDPAGVQAAVRTILADFWTDTFEALWQRLGPAVEDRRRRLEALLAETAPATLFEQLGLRAEYDGEARELRALRGGYRIGFDAVRAIYILPSAANAGRFWTVECGDAPGPQRVWFPWHDPALGAEIGPAMAAGAPEPDLDLVFRALGDPTRWAMLDLLAGRPMAPSELADALGIARSTVSHHLFLLREAGLLMPAAGGRTPLALSRLAFARLSARTLRRFFPGEGEGS